MKPFINLTKAAVWRMRNAGSRPVSVLYASAPVNPAYVHKISFLGDGRWCFANAYQKHAAEVL